MPIHPDNKSGNPPLLLQHNWCPETRWLATDHSAEAINAEVHGYQDVLHCTQCRFYSHIVIRYNTDLIQQGATGKMFVFLPSPNVNHKTHITIMNIKKPTYCQALSCFKAKLKIFPFRPSPSIFIPTNNNISTQFLLQPCVCVCFSVCVCVAGQCLFFCIIIYVNCFGRTVLYMCIECHIQVNMYYVSARGVDERITVHYYYYHEQNTTLMTITIII